MVKGKWIVKYYGTEEMRWFTSLEKATAWAYKMNRSTNDHYVSWLWFMHPRKTTLEYCGRFELAKDPLDSWSGGDSETFQALRDERDARIKAEREAAFNARLKPGAVADARPLLKEKGWVLTCERDGSFFSFGNDKTFAYTPGMNWVKFRATHPDSPNVYEHRETDYSIDWYSRRFAAGVALAEGLCPTYPTWEDSNWTPLEPINPGHTNSSTHSQ